MPSDDYGHFSISSKWLKQLSYEADRRYGETARKLSERYGLEFSQNGKVEISAIIENDQHLSLSEIRQLLYSKIAIRIPALPPTFDLDTELALAIFILRGSPDVHHSFYSVDFIQEDEIYLDNFLKILLSSNELFDRLNFNFRNLQPQFLSGTNMRNTQVRINLKYFYDRVMVEHSGLNRYKFEALKSRFSELGDVRTYPSFEERVIFYMSRVLGKKLQDSDVSKLRAELSFTSGEELEAQGAFTARNQRIISFARETFPDECVGCKGVYPLEDRSFRMPRNDRFYLEINHVVPYANDSSSVDVLDNLVKLCATCHRALTPRRAPEELQKKIIEGMLESRLEVRRFVTGFMGSKFSDPVQYVFQNLK
jgi:5-methylcytosine-specific restriction protein A